MSDTVVVEVLDPAGTVTVEQRIQDEVSVEQFTFGTTAVITKLPEPNVIEIVSSPQGPAGASGLDSELMVRAADALSGHRVVRPLPDGTVTYADCAALGDRDLPLWLTLGAAAQGDLVSVRTFGEVVEPSWSWTPGVPLYLGTDGALTQTPPTSGFLVVVATVPTPTSVFWDLRPPIVLT